nr:hypothetical protein Iba_chr09eCG5710 [Ipomoea batatas]
MTVTDLKRPKMNFRSGEAQIEWGGSGGKGWHGALGCLQIRLGECYAIPGISKVTNVTRIRVLDTAPDGEQPPKLDAPTIFQVMAIVEFIKVMLPSLKKAVMFLLSRLIATRFLPPSVFDCKFCAMKRQIAGKTAQDGVSVRKDECASSFPWAYS